jgi:hypothetical protein
MKNPEESSAAWIDDHSCQLASKLVSSRKTRSIRMRYQGFASPCSARCRAWDTRVGGIELAIPKLRQGAYFPSFLEPRRRAEQALVAVVQEAYVNGV